MKLIQIILFTSIIILSACSTQPKTITDTLTLVSIDNEGYHFQSNTDDTGAFITLTEANNYHISSLNINETITMTFDSHGDIISVNNEEVVQ
ncbi:hypothetical protein KDN24_06340 [Bacillus sp. Bva_UNVM-123]|uniref:hypothetical protein n=1 Tax=Bacillus sp. Bva_UNVM-123 TaxID=2829798 RepID=UPI00391EFDD9